MDIPFAQPEGPAPLEHDTPCIHCGYNLRGLEAAGRCPECGSGITDSTRGDLLKYADPKWLERLRFGTSLKLWNIGIMIVLGLAAGFLVIFGVPQIVLIVVNIVGGMLGLLATVAITSQEPRITLQEDSITLRKVIRACAFAAFLNQFLSLMHVGGFVGVIIIGLNIVCGLLGVVVVFGELIYFRRFAFRIPDERLAKSTKSLMWLLPFGIGVFAVLGVVATLARPTAGATAPPGPAFTPMMGILMTFSCVGLVLMLVGGLWYVRLLTKYNKAFRQAVAEAKVEGLMLHQLAQSKETS